MRRWCRGSRHKTKKFVFSLLTLRNSLEASEPGVLLDWGRYFQGMAWMGKKPRLEMGAKQLGSWGDRPSRRPGVGTRPCAPRQSALQPGWWAGRDRQRNSGLGLSPDEANKDHGGPQ